MTFAEDQAIGEWSVLKLRFLESYLEGYLNATTRAWKRYYIDAFAGYPQYSHRVTGEQIKGSAEVALSRDKGFTKYYFVELNEGRIEQLDGLRWTYPDREISLVQGDCNEIIPSILAGIESQSPTFIFLDTDGIHIKWDTVVAASKRRTELLINFPFYMSMKRQMPWDKTKLQDGSAKRITDFYGTDQWHKILYDESMPEIMKNPALIRLYTANLKALGYKHVICSEPFCSDHGNKLYLLVFASNYAIGEKIMKHVFEKQFNPQGTLFD